MRTYISPAMQVVNISKNDTIQTSVENVTNNVGFIFNNTGSTTEARSAGRRWDEWYEGY